MKCKEPKDLGLKIVSPEEAIWTNVIKQCEASIKEAKAEIMIQEVFLKEAKKELEKRKV